MHATRPWCQSGDTQKLIVEGIEAAISVRKATPTTAAGPVTSTGQWCDSDKTNKDNLDDYVEGALWVIPLTVRFWGMALVLASQWWQGAGADVVVVEGPGNHPGSSSSKGGTGRNGSTVRASDDLTRLWSKNGN